MDFKFSTSAGIVCGFFSGKARADNTDKSARSRADAGFVGVAARRAIRIVRMFNHLIASPTPSGIAEIPAGGARRQEFLMRSFPARDAAKKFGELLDAADAGPVVVRRHGRPRAAVIGWPLFLCYQHAYEERMKDRTAEALDLALKAAIEGKLGTSARACALSRRLGALVDGARNDPPTDEKTSTDEKRGA